MRPEKERSAGSPDNKPTYYGHRSRIRQRFYLNGFGGMLDYEVMEALLIQLIPRRDVKPLAKKLLAEFGSVSETLAQPLNVLEEFPGLGRTTAVGLKIYAEISTYCLQERCCRQGNLLETPELLYNFVRMKLGLLKHENYMLFMLDTNNRLLEYKHIAEGTVNYAFAYIRNIAEAALTIGASKAVLVHNHPSGCCVPSAEDLKSTYKIYNALKNIEVDLVDHLIVTHDEFFSFTAHGIKINELERIVDEYEHGI